MKERIRKAVRWIVHPRKSWDELMKKMFGNLNVLS